jgi:hypothetical protein
MTGWKTVAAALAAVAVAALWLAFGGPAEGRQQTPLAAAARGVVTIDGERVIVEIWAAVPAGADPEVAARAALRRAYPEAALLTDAQSSGYTTTGLIWDVLPVWVNYNGSGRPSYLSESTARNQLTQAMQTWTDVATSSFAFADGGDTIRCPSLVKECPGRQFFDGYNDVGWIDISDPSVLGVTWYSTTIDEFDMAIDNRNFTWSTTCTNVSGQFDLQTVYLHELGHGLGLGHSSDTQAVMYAYYTGAHCQLAQDDVDGVSALYPATGSSTPTNTPVPTDTPAPTATPTPTDTPGPGASPTPTPTPTSCPPGWVKRGRC